MLVQTLPVEPLNPGEEPVPIAVQFDAAKLQQRLRFAPRPTHSRTIETLAHDVSHGGVEQAVGEAAEWSGLEADVELPQGGRGGGQVLLACAPEDVKRLGTKNVARIGAVR